MKARAPPQAVVRDVYAGGRPARCGSHGRTADWGIGAVARDLCSPCARRTAQPRAASRSLKDGGEPTARRVRGAAVGEGSPETVGADVRSPTDAPAVERRRKAPACGGAGCWRCAEWHGGLPRFVAEGWRGTGCTPRRRSGGEARRTATPCRVAGVLGGRSGPGPTGRSCGRGGTNGGGPALSGKTGAVDATTASAWVRGAPPLHRRIPGRGSARCGRPRPGSAAGSVPPRGAPPRRLSRAGPPGTGPLVPRSTHAPTTAGPDRTGRFPRRGAPLPRSPPVPRTRPWIGAREPWCRCGRPLLQRVCPCRGRRPSRPYGGAGASRAITRAGAPLLRATSNGRARTCQRAGGKSSRSSRSPSAIQIPWERSARCTS